MELGWKISPMSTSLKRGRKRLRNRYTDTVVGGDWDTYQLIQCNWKLCYSVTDLQRALHPMLTFIAKHGYPEDFPPDFPEDYPGSNLYKLLFICNWCSTNSFTLPINGILWQSRVYFPNCQSRETLAQIFLMPQIATAFWQKCTKLWCLVYQL